MSRRPAAHRYAPRVWLYVAFVCLVAAGLCVLASRCSLPVRAPHDLPWLVVALVIFALSKVSISFDIQHQSPNFDLSDGAIVFGATVLTADWLIAAVALGVLVHQLTRRSDPIRLVFNVANLLIGTAAALIVMHAVAGSASPADPRGWVAVAVGLLANNLVTGIGVDTMVALNTGVPGVGYFRQMAVQTGMVVVLGGSLTIVAVDAYWAEPWALLPLAVPVFSAAVLLRSSKRQRDRFDDLQSLYGFTVKLADLIERSEIISLALRETREILHCAHIEMYIPRPSGAFRYHLDDHDAIVREAIQPSEMENGVVESRRSRLIQPGGDDAYLAERGFSDAMVVPMADDDHPAIIVAADHDGDQHATFEPDDLKLFQALAAHLSTALTSCGRLDRLRSEVAARQHEAFHDSLTGLANRSLFTQVVTDALTHRRGSRLVAVMLMDLDGFKEINDTLGHHAGDAILREVASRVNQAVGTRRMAARLGGDEFAFILGSATDMEEVTRVTQEVLTAIGAPISVDGMILSMRASVGIAVAPFHGSDASTLLKCADVAMYASKGANKGITVYDAKIDNNSTRRLVLASELQRAVDTDGFELHFQPIADLATGSITGFEALLRWPHYEFGSVAPDEFIPVAEQTGLIEPITWWVVKRALEELKYWRDSGYDLDMAINVSARNLLGPEIVDRLRLLFTGIGVSPGYVTLEVTESSVMADLGDSQQVLQELSDLGLRLAIDDFGTGYSSLARLKVLPFDVVKVDRSFVKDMCHNPDDLAIVRSTIELARVMGHQVVAEGVEDQETWNQLKGLGCTLAQGYFFSFPMSSENCRKWVRSKQSPTLAAVTQLKPNIA